MSHVAKIECEDKVDVKTCKQMCHDMGWTFLENQRTYKWWGRHVGDYPVPEGFSIEDMGKCDHAIRVPGASYEIGVTRNKKNEYKFMWDFYSTGGLQPVLGENAGILKQAYRVAKVKTTARAHGKNCWERPSKKAGWKKIYVEV